MMAVVVVVVVIIVVVVVVVGIVVVMVVVRMAAKRQVTLITSHSILRPALTVVHDSRRQTHCVCLHGTFSVMRKECRAVAAHGTYQASPIKDCSDLAERVPMLSPAGYPMLRKCHSTGNTRSNS